MCMKNINTNILFFDDAILTENNIINLYSANKSTPKIIAKSNNKNELSIENLQFLFLVNACDRNGIYEDYDTPDNTFYFNQEYEIQFRITEPKSGDFFDLGNIQLIEPTDTTKTVQLCRNIYSDSILYKYQNILVPNPNSDNLYVLKVLIRKKTDETNKWIVQSIHPIEIEIKK